LTEVQQVADIIQWRRDTAFNWTAVNPVLALGEAGWETDTGQWKNGDGSTPWTGLPYTGTGPQGEQGDPGTPGEKGDTGDTGATGPPGGNWTSDLVDLTPNNTGIVKGLFSTAGVKNALAQFQSMTQAEYDALTPDTNTIYFIVG
jgi:hypothetical protein